MGRKMILLFVTLAGVVGFLSPFPAAPLQAEGVFPPDREMTTLFSDDFETSEQEWVLALDRANRNKDYEEIEKRLEQLLEELKRLEKDVEKRWRKEVLPHLEKEIERLKKWLRQFRMKEDDREPIKT